MENIMSIQTDLWKKRAGLSEQTKTELEQLDESLEFTDEEFLFLESVCNLLETGQLDEFIDPVSLAVGAGAMHLAGKVSNKLGAMKAHSRAKQQMKLKHKQQLMSLKNKFS
jgi:hypothetical protein